MNKEFTIVSINSTFFSSTISVNLKHLVLEFEIWSLFSFIGEHLDYILPLLVSRTGTVGWTRVYGMDGKLS